MAAAIVARPEIGRIGAEYEHGDEGENPDRADQQHRYWVERAFRQSAGVDSDVAHARHADGNANPEYASRAFSQSRSLTGRPPKRLRSTSRAIPANKSRARAGMPWDAASSRLVSAGRSTAGRRLVMSSTDRNSRWWVASGKRLSRASVSASSSQERAPASSGAHSGSASSSCIATRRGTLKLHSPWRTRL